MSESTFTKSIQFWVAPNGILQFAEAIEKSELVNCILGADSEAVVVEVDYDPASEKEAGHISSLQQLDVIMHLEHVD